MFNEIQDAYNYAVIARDQRLAEMYAKIWLYLLRADAEERRAAKETVRLIRSPANARDLLDAVAEGDAGLELAL